LKKSLELLGILILYGAAGVLFWTFLSAYINGGEITILINYFGEANFELVLLSIVMLGGLILVIIKAKEFLGSK
jgi:hypothetical protein